MNKKNKKTLLKFLDSLSLLFKIPGEKILPWNKSILHLIII